MNSVAEKKKGQGGSAVKKRRRTEKLNGKPFEFTREDAEFHASLVRASRDAMTSQGR
jgi:hypothetical protein